MRDTSPPDTEPREKPTIQSEIDAPFPDDAIAPIDNFENLIQLRAQQHNHNVEDLKNAIGKKLLYGCLIAIVVFAVADAIYKIDSPTFTSAFEVAKVVATTVLGYLFGSRNES